MALKKRGDNHVGLCPFHREKTPSFSVSESKQIFKCFGCGVSGNVYGFIMQIENYSFMEAVKFLADRVNFQIPERGASKAAREQAEKRAAILDMNVRAARFFHARLNDENAGHVRDYLDSRGIRAGVLRKFGLGYTGKDGNALATYLLEEGFAENLIIESGLCMKGERGRLFDRFRKRLMFPIFDKDARVVGFGGRVLGDGQPKYLNSPDTPVFDKKTQLYGINFARKAKAPEIILVEGYMDVIGLAQAGFANCCAALGTAFGEAHARLLKNYTKSVLILFDSDNAGEAAAVRAIPFLRAQGLNVRVLQVTGAKDPDEYIKLYGAQAFADLANKGAEDFITFQVRVMEKQFDLTRADGRVQYIKAAAKLIAGLDAAIEREQYGAIVAQKLGVSESALANEVTRQSDATNSTNTARPPSYKNTSSIISTDRNARALDEARRHLLYAMARDIDGAKYVSKHLKADDFGVPVYAAFYKRCLELYEATQPVTQARLLNICETPEDSRVITAIFDNVLIPESKDDYERGLADRVRTIQINAIDNEIKNANTAEEISKLLERKKILLSKPDN